MRERQLPPIVIPPPPPKQEAVAGTQVTPEPASASLPMLIAEKIRQAKTFAKAFGGYDQAEKFVEKLLARLPPMPLPELLEIIRALKE